MRYIISERQYRIINEQWWNDPKHPEWKKYAPTGYEKGELKKSETVLNNLDPHTIATIFAIGAAFIPVVGPFISAGIGLADAALYYKEGDNKAAGLTAAFSMLPFAGKVVSKIPGVKELGAKGMAALASKLSKGVELVGKELSTFKSIAQNADLIKQELTSISRKLTPLNEQIKKLKPEYVSRYGQDSYENLLRDFLSGSRDKDYFLNKLSAGQKAAPELTNFVTKFGVKFSKEEIEDIAKISENIMDDNVEYVMVNTKEGPRLVTVYKVDSDWIMKHSPGYESSNGWASSKEMRVYLNQSKLEHLYKKQVEDVVVHEFAHIKDPSLIKSPVFQKLYSDEAQKGIQAWEKVHRYNQTDFKALGLTPPTDEINKLIDVGFKKYYLNPNEIIANNTMTLQSLATQTKKWSEVYPKKEILKGLDDIIRFAKGDEKGWSDVAQNLMGYHYPNINNYIDRLSKKPSEYRKLWNKLAQQAEYLKSQIKIGL
jgi:hypothetical protein